MRQNDFNPPLTCTDLKEQEGFPGCCEPCHWEAEHGYDDLESAEIDGVLYIVCCEVGAWLHDRVNDESR